MATYANLLTDHYYLICEKEETEIMLVQPVMETGKCLLILYIDEIETTLWKKKEDTIFQIIEELSEEQVVQYEALFDEDEDDEDWDDDDEFDDATDIEGTQNSRIIM